MATSIQKPQVIASPFCGSGDKNVIPATATGTNLASIEEGFPPITSKPLNEGGIPPERKDFNGILNLDSQFYFAFQNGWRPTFDADVSTAIGGYAQGAVLWYDAGNCFVKSLKNNNTDNFVSDPTKIDGVSWMALAAGDFHLPLFAFDWFDYVPTDMSWVRADLFGWIPGDTYSTAYNHLVADIDGISSSTETIAGTTITYYLSSDGHKIVLADQENNVSTIYAATGVAWYYILDTDNTRFKLPRINPARKEQLLKLYAKGNGMTLGFTNGTQLGGLSNAYYNSISYGLMGAISAYGTDIGTQISNEGTNILSNEKSIGITTDSTKSGIIADIDDADTIFSGKKYLYFYLGQFTQTAIQQTAGLNAELFNQKVDKLDMTEVQCVVETYSNGTEWYRIYSDGWCEQGGKVTLSASTYIDVNLLKPYANTDYSCFQSHNYSGTGSQAESYILPIDETSLRVGNSCGNTQTFCWIAKGYIS